MKLDSVDKRNDFWNENVFFLQSLWCAQGKKWMLQMDFVIVFVMSPHSIASWTPPSSVKCTGTYLKSKKWEEKSKQEIRIIELLWVTVTTLTLLIFQLLFSCLYEYWHNYTKMGCLRYHVETLEFNSKAGLFLLFQQSRIFFWHWHERQRSLYIQFLIWDSDQKWPFCPIPKNVTELFHVCLLIFF